MNLCGTKSIKGIAIIMMLWLHCYNLGCTKDPAYQTSFLCSLINLSSRISSFICRLILLSRNDIIYNCERKDVQTRISIDADEVFNNSSGI